MVSFESSLLRREAFLVAPCFWIGYMELIRMAKMKVHCAFVKGETRSVVLISATMCIHFCSIYSFLLTFPIVLKLQNVYVSCGV